MRLIDADKLEAHEQITPLGNGMYESTFVVYKDDIDAQPTVDAIPITWVKAWYYQYRFYAGGEIDDLLETWEAARKDNDRN